jgi:phage terminase small subunit
MAGANKKPGDLTPKQERFCKEYMIDLNATQAANRAGYSKKTAEEQGCRLLRNVKVQKRLSKLRASWMEKYEITEERIMTELSILGFVNPADFFTSSGQYVNIKALEELPPEATRAITGITVNHTMDGTKYSYRFGGKTKALELMMRRYAMLNDRLILDDKMGIFKHADKKKLKTKYDKFRNGKSGNKG